MQISAAVSSSKNERSSTAPAVEQFDTRGMEAPRHILAILKKVSELPSASSLEVRLDNQPMQLYDLLQQRGFFLITEKQTDGSFLGLIRPRTLTDNH